jgi:hypothetical protein
VQIHLAEGNAVEALQAFYSYRELMRRDLQLEPSTAMRDLVAPLLSRLGSGTPSPWAVEIPAQASRR